MRYTVFFVLALAGCTVGPDYKAPEREVPDSWTLSKAEVADLTQTELDSWWLQFNDPLLNELMLAAKENNPSVRIALAQVREARARERAALSGRYPEVQFDAGAVRSRQSGNSQFGAIPGFELTNNTFDATFDARWELDIWGKERRRREAAAAATEATIYAERDVMISVYAELARAYMTMRGADFGLGFLRRNIALQERTVATVKRLVDAGLVDRNALTRAKAALAQTAATEPAVIAERESAMYAVSVLTGKPPGTLKERLKDTGELVPLPDRVKAGLPSDILKRRPDIRIAERRLAGETAEIGVAVAQLYPSISLTASIGFESLEADDLLESMSRTWMVGPKLSLPIFDRGRLKAMVEIEEAQVDAAMARYEQTLLTAMQEVEETLVRYAHSLDTRDRYQQAVNLNREVMETTERRFKAGEDSLLDLLDAQRQAVSSVTRLAEAEVNARINLVAVYKALGGGWE
jgi:NodT family efflux transporter outer membrane factor (OMF) lipoprotein